MSANEQNLHNERLELLNHINRITDKPIIALSFVWLLLLIIELTAGLNPLLGAVVYVIWVIFVLDFVVEFLIAPKKVDYLRHNWLTVISLVLPAFRVLSIFRVLRVLRAARAARTLSLVRVLTSANRGMRTTARTLGKRNIGYVVALTLIIVFTGGAAMAAFESPASLQEQGYDQDHALESYGEAVWWTAMIMTTLGSEYWPQTVEGRILCWLLSLYAFGVFGYITATLASFFVGTDTKLPSANEQLQAEIVALRTQVALLLDKLDAQLGIPPD